MRANVKLHGNGSCGVHRGGGMWFRAVTVVPLGDPLLPGSLAVCMCGLLGSDDLANGRMDHEVRSAQTARCCVARGMLHAQHVVCTPHTACCTLPIVRSAV
jgi:hypothetical protein